jgi:hypothetical protein
VKTPVPKKKEKNRDREEGRKEGKNSILKSD